MAEDNKKKKAGLIASGTAVSRTAGWFNVVDKYNIIPKESHHMYSGGRGHVTGSKTFGRTWVRTTSMLKEPGEAGLRRTTFNFKKGTLGHKLVGGAGLQFKEKGFASAKNIADFTKRSEAWKVWSGKNFWSHNLHKSNIVSAQPKPHLKHTYKFTDIVIGKKGSGLSKRPGRPIGGSLSSAKRPVVNIHKGYKTIPTNLPKNWNLYFGDEIPKGTKFKRQWKGTQHVLKGSKLGQAITSRGLADAAKMAKKAAPGLKALGKVGTGLSGVGTAWMTYDLVTTAFEQQKNIAPTKKQKIYGLDVGTPGKYGIDY